MTKAKTYEATLHFFEGFYYTLAGDACSCPEYECDYFNYIFLGDGTEYNDHYVDIVREFNECVKEEDREKVFSDAYYDYVYKYDHSAARQEYCELYVAEVCDALGIMYDGFAMSSPKEYNFETDKIHMKLKGKDLRAFVKRLKTENEVKDNLKIILENRHTSCSGFISFYSNDLDDWLDKRWYEFDNIEAGSLIEAILMTDCPEKISEEKREYNFDYDVYDYFCSNCQLNYAADFEKIMHETIAQYHDENDDDDYVKPLPSRYLKGEIFTTPAI